MAAARRSTSSFSSSSRWSGGFWPGLLGLTLVAAILVGIIAVFTGFDRTQGGEIAVVRNGGPLDNHKIRQVIEPASSLTWVGMWSTSHKYPAQQRFYTITSRKEGGDRSGVDVENVP